MAAKKKLLLGGYFASMQDSDGKARYIDKLASILMSQRELSGWMMWTYYTYNVPAIYTKQIHRRRFAKL